MENFDILCAKMCALCVQVCVCVCVCVSKYIKSTFTGSVQSQLHVRYPDNSDICVLEI